MSTPSNRQVFSGDALSHPQGLIVHGCNCQGVMGSGIALAVKQRYPEAFAAYNEVYQKNHDYPDEGYPGLALGQIIPVEVEPMKWIVNAMTQHLYGFGERRVNYEAVATCFEKTRDLAVKLKEYIGIYPDIVYPQIGAGLGGGNWNIIQTIIDETLLNYPGNHVLYMFNQQAAK